MASDSLGSSIDKNSLQGITADFFRGGPDLLGRWTPYYEWIERRLADGVEPYGKSSTGQISTETTTRIRNGVTYSGVNFASQDYLNLSSHRLVHKAAKEAIDIYGVHSAGSAALMGNTHLSTMLESRLASFLGYRDCTVFPTGWGAGYGIVKTLVRSEDHVVIDVLAHACLQEGARNATAKVHSVPHCSGVAVERRLQKIRANDPECGILEQFR